jgi:hypothetical protein
MAPAAKTTMAPLKMRPRLNPIRMLATMSPSATSPPTIKNPRKNEKSAPLKKA